MKKTYTREQIQKAISHWKQILEDIDEDPIEIRQVNPGISVKCYTNSELKELLTPRMLSKITQLRANLYDEEKWRWNELGRKLTFGPGNESEVKSYILNELAYIAIVFFNGNIIGFGGASKDENDEKALYLDECCIDQRYRKFGAATMMVQSIISTARKGGIHTFFADVDVNNPASEKHLMRNGFKKFSTKFILSQ